MKTFFIDYNMESSYNNIEQFHSNRDEYYITVLDSEYKNHTNSNLASTVNKKSKGGRKKSFFRKLLDNFFLSIAKNKSLNKIKIAIKHPNKDFFNTKLIRIIKKYLRSLSNQKNDPPPAFSTSILSEEEFHIKQLLISIFQKNHKDISIISKTESGPKTDGIAHRKSENAIYKSHNSTFCKEFFSHSYMREIFKLMLNLIFTDFSPKRCCERFQFFCCLNAEHNEGCINKWSELKKYLEKKYFTDMKIKKDAIEVLENNSCPVNIDIEKEFEIVDMDEDADSFLAL